MTKMVKIAATAALCAAGTLQATAQMSPAPMSPVPSSSASGSVPANGSMLPAAQTGPAVNFPLTENGKPGGTPGQVTIAQRGSDLVVTVQDPDASVNPAPAMIVKGTCDKPTGKAAYKLTPVSGGTSQTVVKRVTVAQLTGGGYVLIEARTPRKCADLNNANPITPTQH